MRYIGEIMKERMDLLGMNVNSLERNSFVDRRIICYILDDVLAYEEIDKFQLSLLCDALHCDEQYFTDETIRNKDLVIATRDDEKDSVQSNRVKAKIQTLVNDDAFVSNLESEQKTMDDRRKVDITLTTSEWSKLRPTVKTLQKEKELEYSVQSYATDRVLVICECTRHAENTIDAKLQEILGHIYA